MLRSLSMLSSFALKHLQSLPFHIPFLLTLLLTIGSSLLILLHNHYYGEYFRAVNSNWEYLLAPSSTYHVVPGQHYGDSSVSTTERHGLNHRHYLYTTEQFIDSLQQIQWIYYNLPNITVGRYSYVYTSPSFTPTTSTDNNNDHPPRIIPPLVMHVTSYAMGDRVFDLHHPYDSSKHTTLYDIHDIRNADSDSNMIGPFYMSTNAATDQRQSDLDALNSGVLHSIYAVKLRFALKNFALSENVRTCFTSQISVNYDMSSRNRISLTLDSSSSLCNEESSSSLFTREFLIQMLLYLAIALLSVINQSWQMKEFIDEYRQHLKAIVMKQRQFISAGIDGNANPMNSSQPIYTTDPLNSVRAASNYNRTSPQHRHSSSHPTYPHTHRINVEPNLSYAPSSRQQSKQQSIELGTIAASNQNSSDGVDERQPLQSPVTSTSESSSDAVRAPSQSGSANSSSSTSPPHLTQSESLIMMVKALWSMLTFWWVMSTLSNSCNFIACIWALGGTMRLEGSAPMRKYLIGVGCAASWISTMRFFESSQAYYVLVSTLRKGTPRVLRFIAGVFPIFIAFALLGVSLFASDSQRFGSVDQAFATLFSLLNGDVIHETFAELYTSYPLVSRLYLYAFVTLFIYAVLNILIAIMEDSFFASKAYQQISQRNLVTMPTPMNTSSQIRESSAALRYPVQPQGGTSYHMPQPQLTGTNYSEASIQSFLDFTPTAADIQELRSPKLHPYGNGSYNADGQKRSNERYQHHAVSDADQLDRVLMQMTSRHNSMPIADRYSHAANDVAMVSAQRTSSYDVHSQNAIGAGEEYGENNKSLAAAAELLMYVKEIQDGMMQQCKLLLATKHKSIRPIHHPMHYPCDWVVAPTNEKANGDASGSAHREVCLYCSMRMVYHDAMGNVMNEWKRILS